MNGDLDRRRFLQALGIGAAQLAAGPLLGTSSVARAAHHCTTGSWGAIQGTVGGSGGWTCDNHEGYKILEIFLHGGASQWETFWLPGSGAPLFTDFGLGIPPTPPPNQAPAPFLDLAGLVWGANSTSPWCKKPDIPATPKDYKLFARDANNAEIFWGAPAKPLYRRSDILSRCRMITQYHDLLPHEAAIPYATSGLRLGNPNRAGTGAAYQRRARVVDLDQSLPVSYVLHQGGSAATEAARSGIHPGSARPVVIQVGNTDNFVKSMARSGVTSESDDLLLALRGEFFDRLRFRGAGEPVRSSGFEGYSVAAELLAHAPDLQDLFAGQVLVIDDTVTVCPTLPPTQAGHSPAAKTMLQAAGSLLSSGPARYVCVVDSGIAGGYDTHGQDSQSQIHLLTTTANLYNVLHHLADVIHDPVENPDGTVDLNNTMVLVNSEFGRTPEINGWNGRDHWVQGYVTLLIGGPLSGGASILGAIDADAITVLAHRYSPTDVRGALLLVAGIDPFAEGNFRFADFSDELKSGISTETALRERLRGVILGL